MARGTVAYHQYDIRVCYETQNGLYQLTNGKPVRVHEPTQMKTVEFIVKSTNKQPDLPSSIPGPNEYLIYEDVSPVSPKATGDQGQTLYVVTGKYIFGMITPVTKDNGGYVVGLPPYYIGATTIRYQNSAFLTDIVPVTQ